MSFHFDRRWFGDSDRKGKITLITGVMGSGKSESLGVRLSRAQHQYGNVIGFSPSQNTRDNSNDNRVGRIRSTGGSSIPARLYSYPGDLVGDINSVASAIFSNKYGERGSDGRLDVDGIIYTKGRPVKVVGIDEVNFAVTQIDHVVALLDSLGWARDAGIDVFLAGLDRDFRGNSFRHMNVVRNYVDTVETAEAYCKVYQDGRQCGKDAQFSMRVMSDRYALDNLPSEIVKDLPVVDFEDRNAKRHEGVYVAAPYFDRTLRVGGSEGNDLFYVASCRDCFTLPFRDEVQKIRQVFGSTFDTVSRSSLSDVVSNSELLEQCLTYLQGEVDPNGVLLAGSRFIESVGGDSYRPLPLTFLDSIGAYVTPDELALLNR